MKSILKLFLFMGIILVSKYTKENEIATASATTKTGKVESSFINLKQQANVLDEQKEKEIEAAADVVY
ncbi:hypothetical protein [Pontibacter cellulosilyticus]|uniref:Uncharacterized protein n=1 Tax=Pontibacter cellulosilyticus TaxID=1720253 RepID=A0A923N9K9_9BACT|nr:hypothetical protein [Pontibacter cellulosilyticus]MBC5994728.1 hypothetical protein [Pontibacter cellulosilyticus]